MSTETKSPTLIPALDQTMETVRDNYFGGKFPPETNGDLPGYRPASAAVAEESKKQAESVMSTRKRERKITVRKVARYGAVLVTAVGIGAATTEVAQLMGNTEHPSYLDKNTPAHTASHH